MNTKIRGVMTVVCAVVVMAAGAACSKRAPKPPVKATSGSAVLPAELMLSSPPEGVMEIPAAKGSVAKGATVAVRGRIGGSRRPFVAERAVFTIVDPAIPSCAEGEDDECPTPWDYCCEPRERLAEHSATVQVLGANGAPLQVSLDGVSGLVPLAEVLVVGGVAEGPAGALILNATGIYVVPATAPPSGG